MPRTNSLEDAEVIVQKLPSDIGIHRNPRKGTLDAPEKVLEDFEFEKTVLVTEVFPDEFSLENTHRRIEDNTDEIRNFSRPLVSIGGDHSVSYPVIRAMKREHPDMKLVWLDAHLDLKEKVNNHVSHDVVVRELLEHGFSEEEIWFVGITHVDDDEQDFLDGRDLRVFRSGELEEFRRKFNTSEQHVYLSVDIDVLTREEAPGTGYPDGELDLEQVLEVIDLVSPDYADLVEVAPSLDEDKNTIDSARKILARLMKQF